MTTYQQARGVLPADADIAAARQAAWEGEARVTPLFKVLEEDGSAIYGQGRWRLPAGDGPGKWMPTLKGDLVPCARGYHLTTAEHLVEWLGPAIYLAEADGEIVVHGTKVVARRARLLRRLPWDERTERLFACDCAAHVLPLYERHVPSDVRPRRAIETARRYALNLATMGELAAARDAARDAVREATRDNIPAAAWNAVRAAAGGADWDTGVVTNQCADAAIQSSEQPAAARDAERQWQTNRLLTILGLEHES